MKNTKSIAVLLTCHNRKLKTLSCLKNLLQQNGLDDSFSIDIFLTDDGSDDGTPEDVKKEFPEVTIINGTGDLYWNRGMILAWEKAAEKSVYDFYIWLNDDVILFDDAIKTVLSDEKIKKDSIICGATCSPITRQMTYGGRNEKSDLINPNGAPQICETINGNFVLIPKYVYEKNGTLDSFFSHAIGDFDYGLRARKIKIDSYASSKFIGECEKPDSLPKWCLPEIALPDRLKVLYSPKGYSQPFHQFVFERRHFGIRKAIFHYLTIHLRVLFPSLWIKS